MKWTVMYNNDVGPNDEGFWEWWEVYYEGKRVFKADTEEDAKNLAGLLNRVKADRELNNDAYID